MKLKLLYCAHRGLCSNYKCRSNTLESDNLEHDSNMIFFSGDA